MTEMTLEQVLDSLTVEGELYEHRPDNAVRCSACGHRCLIREGRRGICKVRFNEEGVLRVPHGYVGGLQCDPTEKKPFFHLYPGSDTLTFGMLGCDFHCSYCQNWISSQALRDPAAEASGAYPRQATPRQMVEAGKAMGAQLVASSYNEPLITSEWAVAVFKEARRHGLECAFVSNGNVTREALEYIRPYTIGYKIDLKTMSDKNYRKLGGVLQNVLDGIRLVREMGFWLEVVTLVVPGFNDSTEELMDAARFLANLSPDIPWHVTAFHKNYKLVAPGDTSADMLIRAAEIGVEAGLHYVYAGNLPGEVGEYENTYCSNCRQLLIERLGFLIMGYHLTDDGRCPRCQAAIAGIWPRRDEVRISRPEDLFYRQPRLVH